MTPFYVFHTTYSASADSAMYLCVTVLRCVRGRQTPAGCPGAVPQNKGVQWQMGQSEDDLA